MAVDNAAGSVGTEVVKGAVIGGLATGAVLVLAPVALPLIGLGAAAATITGLLGVAPWGGAAIGAWYKYNQATK